MLLQEAGAGLQQVVILGAGFDSRAVRFADALKEARVFEVDMPEVLALRTERFGSQPCAASATPVPIDFEREDLGLVLRDRGYASAVRTLFFWEGVTYYLPEDAVRAVLSLVASQSDPGAASCSTM